MRQLLNGLAIGLVTIGLVGCSNTNWWSSNSQSSSMSSAQTAQAKPTKVAKSKTTQTTTMASNTSTGATTTTTTTDTTTTGDRTQFESQRISSSFSNNMEPTDKAQLREAFENNPVGQTSNWKNDKTGVSYQVTPTKNVTYKGNEYCREYTMTNNKGEQKQGVACRSKGAVWSPAS